MKNELERDLGEEIIVKLRDLINKLNKLQKEKDEKELTDSCISRNPV